MSVSCVDSSLQLDLSGYLMEEAKLSVAPATGSNMGPTPDGITLVVLGVQAMRSAAAALEVWVKSRRTDIMVRSEDSESEITISTSLNADEIGELLRGLESETGETE